jgi:hypothetical protein
MPTKKGPIFLMNGDRSQLGQHSDSNRAPMPKSGIKYIKGPKPINHEDMVATIPHPIIGANHLIRNIIYNPLPTASWPSTRLLRLAPGTCHNPAGCSSHIVVPMALCLQAAGIVGSKAAAGVVRPATIYGFAAVNVACGLSLGPQ